MSTLTFNTLDFADKLKAAGVPAPQAEAQARAMADVLSGAREDLATKGDLREMRAETKADLRALEAKMDTRFAKVEGELALLKWMLGVVVAGVLALVMKAFLHA